MSEYYRTIQGDTWDMIAKKVYGAEKYLDYLMSNNFPLLDHVIFPTGVEVHTPELSKQYVKELPIWRKGAL